MMHRMIGGCLEGKPKQDACGGMAFCPLVILQLQRQL